MLCGQHPKVYVGASFSRDRSIRHVEIISVRATGISTLKADVVTLKPTSMSNVLKSKSRIHL